MSGTYHPLPTSGSLASQIRESLSERVQLSGIVQDGLVAYCKTPEDLINLFIDALEKYPPAIFRVPLSVVLIEVSLDDDDDCKSNRRKLKKAMKKLGPVVRNALRETDVVIRYGLKNFAVLLVGLDEVHSAKICQRIKEAIRRFSFLSLRSKSQLQVQFAIAQHDPGCGNDLGELVFADEHNIRLARALGNGAIVTRSEVKEHFQEHHRFGFTLGESLDSEILES